MFLLSWKCRPNKDKFKVNPSPFVYENYTKLAYFLMHNQKLIEIQIETIITNKYI